MFIISQQGYPAARLHQEETGEWVLQYLRETAHEIHPAYPFGKARYISKDIPRFILSLLPNGPRRAMMEKARHISPGDLSKVVRQCLALDNVGDLTLAVDMREAAQGHPLSIEAPVPNRLVASAVEDLMDTKVRQGVLNEMKQKAASTGLGGHFPKAFLTTPKGGYIVKYYPDLDTSGADIARLEAKSLSAAQAAGLPIATGEAYGNFFVSRRFDRDLNKEQYSVCHLADFFNEQDLYTGSYDKMVRTTARLGADVARDLTRQVLFSWALGDSDHHGENFALIRRWEGRTAYAWKTAPLYDSLPSRILTGDTEQMALTIGGKKNRLELKDFVVFGKLGGLEADEVQSFLAQTQSIIRDIVLPFAPSHLQRPFEQHLNMVEKIAAGAKYHEAIQEGKAQSLPSLSVKLAPDRTKAVAHQM